MPWARKERPAHRTPRFRSIRRPHPARSPSQDARDGRAAPKSAVRPAPRTRVAISPTPRPGRLPPAPRDAPPSSARHRGAGPLSSVCARRSALRDIPPRRRARADDVSAINHVFRRRDAGCRRELHTGAAGREARGRTSDERLGDGARWRRVGDRVLLRAPAGELRGARRSAGCRVSGPRLPDGCRVHESLGLLRLLPAGEQGRGRADRCPPEEVVGAPVHGHLATPVRHVHRAS